MASTKISRPKKVKKVYKRRRKTEGYYHNGVFIPLKQDEENSKFIQVQARENGFYINQYMPEFFEEYKTALNEVCGILSEHLTEKLREFILDGAYQQTANSDYYYLNNNEPTYEFLEAWDVTVFISRGGILRFEPRYFWESMSLEYYDGTDRGKRGGVVSHFSLHGSAWGGEHTDFREYLGEILNMPISGGRRGRWYERFLDYCNTVGVEIFKNLCKQYGIIL